MAPDPLASVAAALAPRYAIERELGRGASAVVYLAHDSTYDRKVAVKVLFPDLAVGIRAERFVREVQITAQLSHPYILPVLDTGSASGFLYYVLPYVKGESLRERLQRERQLPLDDAVRIAREVAEALDYAHGLGILHRDIKPENIMLQAGHAVVADFGIARATRGEGTLRGGVEGTPAYMSPEQAAGDPLADGRSDVYSLACVLFEMLVGHSPFTGRTAQEMIAQHTLDSVPTVRAARRAVPPDLERTIMKALAKHQVDRFASAAQFSQAVTASASTHPARSFRTAAILGGLLLIAGAGWGAWRWTAATREMRGAPAAASVAVLPFVNLSGDTANAYLSDGVSEELINALVQVPGLRVPSRTSSFFFRDRNLSLRQIGESLHVATVLEGSLRKAGNKLRITAQLINVSDGFHLWSHTYDREFAAVHDVIGIQEEIARAIVGALRITLVRDSSASFVRRHTADPEAYQMYLLGRFFWNKRTQDGTLRAIDYLRRAIERDSNYMLAYTGLSDAYLGAGQQGFIARAQAYPGAVGSASKALALDPLSAEAHTSLGRVRTSFEWNLPAAEQEFQRAIALNPSYPWARSWYGLWVLSVTGRLEVAIREAQAAVDLEPLNQGLNHNLGIVLYHARQ